jgi:hypothetical protein
MMPTFEQGDTIQFTWESLVAPDAAPAFSITEPFSKTVIQTGTALASGSLAFYGLFTMPQSLGVYLYEFAANKTISGSVYPFVDRGTFRVEKTRLP